MKKLKNEAATAMRRILYSARKIKLNPGKAPSRFSRMQEELLLVYILFTTYYH